MLDILLCYIHQNQRLLATNIKFVYVRNENNEIDPEIVFCVKRLDPDSNFFSLFLVVNHNSQHNVDWSRRTVIIVDEPSRIDGAK